MRRGQRCIEKGMHLLGGDGGLDRVVYLEAEGYLELLLLVLVLLSRLLVANC